jgi:CubicO group peptidase (beta-lactamase class C family)
VSAGTANFIRAQLAIARVPGAAVVIVRNGDEPHVWSHGSLSISDSRPVSSATRFHLASATKVVTALTCAVLVSKGKIDPHAPVSEFIGSLIVGGTDIAAETSLSLLFTHQAGLPHYICNLHDAGMPSTLGDVVERVLPELPLLARPGAICSYSNLGATVAGYVAEHVCGMPFSELATRIVLRPLGMTDTVLGGAALSTAHSAVPHRMSEDSIPEMAPPPVPGQAECASSLAITTGADLGRLLRALLPGSRTWADLMLDEAVRSLLYTVQASRHRPGEQGFTWAFLKRQCPSGRNVYGRPGGIGGFGIRMSLDPDQGDAVAFMYNLSHHALNGYMSAVANEAIRRLHVHHAGMAPDRASADIVPESGPDPTPGYYISRYGGWLEVGSTQGRTWARLNGGDQLSEGEMHVVDDGTLYCNGVAFFRKGDGPFERADTNLVPCGTFRGECFGEECRFTVSASGEALVAGFAGQPLTALRRVDSTTFVCADATITADPRGMPSRILLYGYISLDREEF